MFLKFNFFRLFRLLLASTVKITIFNEEELKKIPNVPKSQ